MRTQAATAGTNQQTPAPLRLLNDKELAAILGISSRTIQRHVDAGIVPAGIKVGAARRWDSEAIQSWISAGCPRVRPAGKPAR